MAKFTCNFISYTLRRAVDITVIIPSITIPEAMNQEKAPVAHTKAEPFPVLYLLHGMGNNHATWTGYTNVELFAEERQIAVVNLSAENKGYVPNGRDDYFRFVAEELPDFVCGMFPVSRRPEDTYIAGLSMGGYGTLIHGLNYPERFAAIGSFSGATALPPAHAAGDNARIREAAIRNEKAGDPDIDPMYNPFALVDKLVAEGRKLPKIYMACGDQDFLLRVNLAFRDHLREAGADLTWEEVPGYGHEWRFWNMEIERFLDWIPRSDSYAAGGRRRV